MIVWKGILASTCDHQAATLQQHSDWFTVTTQDLTPILGKDLLKHLEVSLVFKQESGQHVLNLQIKIKRSTQRV